MRTPASYVHCSPSHSITYVCITCVYKVSRARLRQLCAASRDIRYNPTAHLTRCYRHRYFRVISVRTVAKVRPVDRDVFCIRSKILNREIVNKRKLHRIFLSFEIKNLQLYRITIICVSYNSVPYKKKKQKFFTMNHSKNKILLKRLIILYIILLVFYLQNSKNTAHVIGIKIIEF